MFGKKINAMKRTSTKFYSDKPEPESENPQKPSVAALKNYKKICNKSLGSKNSKNIEWIVTPKQLNHLISLIGLRQ